MIHVLVAEDRHVVRDALVALLGRDDLAVSSATVRNHLSNTMATLHADTRIDAVNIARDNGWLA